MKTMLALSRQRRFWLCGWLAACAMVATPLGAQSIAPRIDSPVINSERAILTGSLHPMAKAEFDAGRVPAATKLSGISIYFNHSAEQEADLDTLVAAQQNPASHLYHQWLTPDQFAARFGLADSDLDTVKSWLQQQRFSIDSVARSRNMIRFSGTASQVEQAFSTQMHYYNVGGARHMAPSTELSVPKALASVVLAVGNLNDFRPKPMHVAPANRDFTSSQSGDVFFAPGDIATAYDIKPLYQAGDTGAGQSIALMGQSAIVVSDIENFQNASGLSVKDPTLVLVPGSGSSQTYGGDETESDIDIEWSGAIAQGANIIFVYTGNSSTGNILNYGVFDSFQYAVDEDIAPIISISYGGCEVGLNGWTVQQIAPYEALGKQAITQGQTIVVSSGDHGSTACYGEYGNTGNLTTSTAPAPSDEVLSVSYPASSAYVVAAGGTEITSADAVTGTPPGYWLTAPNSSTDQITSVLQWIPEVAWNDDAYVVSLSPGLTASEWAQALSATGGGVSTLVPMPTWQSTFPGIPSGTMRLVPDISLYASPNFPGYLFCSSDPSALSTSQVASCNNGFRDSSTGYLTVAGGTSFAAPIFAGMVAIINQAEGYTGGQGLINPTLYTLAANSANYNPTNPVFHDITAGSSAGTSGTGNECLSGSSYCSTAGTNNYPTATGYDLATGLGSVDLAKLIAAWTANPANPAPISTTTTISASSSTPALNATDTFTITVVSADGTTTPSGSVTLYIDGGGTAYNNGGTKTTAQLSPSTTPGTATTTYSTSFSTAGTHQIVAQYPGNATFALSTGIVQVSIASVSSGKGTFTLGATPSTLTITDGSTGTENLTVTPASGYLGTVLLSFDTSNDTALQNLCYEFTTMTSSGGGSVAVTGTTAVTTQLSFDTNPADCPAAQKPVGGTPFHRLGGVKTASNNSPNPAPLGIAFAGLLLAGFLGRSSRKFHTLAGLIALLALGLAISACGGSNNSTTTTVPTGSYTITVSGQDSTTATITGSTSFTLTIQ